MTIPANADVRRLLDEAGNRLLDEDGNFLVDNWHLRPHERRVFVLRKEGRELIVLATKTETESTDD